jgi:hypothetical protein
LTEVIKRVLAPLPAHTSITQVFCDLNGERHRSDEWGFTVPRIAGRLKDPGMLSAPSVVWGDCGAVNGLLLLALAAAAGQRDGVAAAHALVWTSSDGAERAAAVLRAEPPTAVAAPAPAGGMPAAQLPSWAAELDDSMLLEMVDECDFRLEQRAFQLCRLCGDNPPADFDPVARAEDFLEALVLGLVECGTRAIDAAKQAIEPEAPGTTYAAVRALLEGGQVRPAIELAKELLLSDPSSEVAIAQAFLHARAPAIGQTGVAALLEAPAPFFLLGLQVAAAAGMEVPTPTLLKLAQGLPSERQVEFLNACGRVGGPDFRSYLAPWEGSPDPAVRREAALADVLIGKAACRERLLAKAGADAALLLPAALLVDDRRAGWLSALARAKPGADAVLAAGLAGEAGATAFLLDRMVDPAEAGAAAAALEILLGVSCFEEQETPDEDPSAPPQIVRRLSYARAAWEQAARQALTPPPPPVRLRCGKPGTAATTVELLRRPHLPLVARQYLGYELAARWGGSRAFDASAPVRAQRSYLSRLDPPPA